VPNCFILPLLYGVVAKILQTDAVKIINLTTKHVCKLPTSTQLCATWHTDSPDMVALPSTSALRYHDCCIGGSTIPEYFGYMLVYLLLYTYSGPSSYDRPDIRTTWVMTKILVLTYDQSLELRPECRSRPKRVSACVVVNKDRRCVRKRQSEPRYACLWV
jgi:hypothetical protein